MSSRDQAVAWQPDAATRARAQLTRFLAHCGMDSYAAAERRAIADTAWFHEQLLGFLNLDFHRPWRQVLDLSRGPAWARWCVGGGLNITTGCLDRHVSASTPAVIWEGEEGTRRELSYAQLLADVERCAAGLRGLGLRPGDTAAIHLPMTPEAVIALLALGRIGAIAVPLFSGYGAAAIEARLRDVGAKLLFTCDGFPRRGVTVEAKGVADEAVARCPAVHTVVVVRRLGCGVTMQPGRDIEWDELLQSGDTAGAGAPEPTDAEDPLMVLYTSGTSGPPKGILHSHCGFPVKAAQDMAFGTDVGPGDRIAWITDLGWMMGPWLIYGALLLGATIVLYDGAPDYPQPDRLWAFCEANRVGILGISPTLVRALAARGNEWPRRHDLSSLRIFGSTGEPWNPEPWWWLFEEVGNSRIPIINYSGGTEISGGILMGNPLLPVKPYAFAAPCLGMDAAVFDEQGRPVTDAIGELVIRQPWIGMARGFWGNPQQYLETYWSRWPGVWTHGDWARVDADGHWHILGRSDDTIKVAGKRVGPAEVESVLAGHASVLEAAVVGVPDERKGMSIVAFCVLETEANDAPHLAAELRELVGRELAKPLRPEHVFFVPALPHTRNGKTMRRVIRAAFLGEDPGNLTALENPASLEAIRQCATTQIGRSD